jgi:hypothetical protein
MERRTRSGAKKGPELGDPFITSNGLALTVSCNCFEPYAPRTERRARTGCT